MTTNKRKTQDKEGPEANTQRFMSWANFPTASKAERFSVTDPDGDQRETCVTGTGTIRVLKALINGPLYCASPVRISDRVLLLKRDYGFNIRTETYANDAATSRMRYGVYYLDDVVTLIDGQEVAA